MYSTIEQKGTHTYYVCTLKLFLPTNQLESRVHSKQSTVLQYKKSTVQYCSIVQSCREVSIWEVGRYSSRVQLRVRVGVGKPRGGSVFFLFREWRPSCRRRQYRSTPVHRFAAAEFTVYQSHQRTSVLCLALYSCPSLGRHYQGKWIEQYSVESESTTLDYSSLLDSSKFSRPPLRE